MTAHAIGSLVVFLGVLLALAWPLGQYMARVYMSESLPLERPLYRLAGVRPDEDMDWKQYAWAVLLFNLFGLLAVYAIQRLQGVMPLNPLQLPAVNPELSFNTAISFASNTNWQAYSGETTLSYAVQMLGLTVQNFMSAATGIAVLVALIRGLTRRQSPGVGNFW
ncbi:MAG TPA: potassium-transporting ATPase subunit KdpA, partial [Polyangiales bacterium]|nr:potassium-transporting ATPase subunit KdpA [Polyangiales bacterium]